MKLPLIRFSAILAIAWAASCAAQAQYKVVNPDGSVSYTDRPPAASNVRVTPINRNSAGATREPSVALPAELRAVVQRHPVVLYTMADCEPCGNARKLLQQRGVPFNERTIVSEDDAAALVRLVGGRTVPAMSVGAQPVRGFSDTDWNAFLDVAGYPRESRLPAGWPAPSPTPLVERVSTNARAPTARPAPVEAQPEPQAAPTSGNRIRF